MYSMKKLTALCALGLACVLPANAGFFIGAGLVNTGGADEASLLGPRLLLGSEFMPSQYFGARLSAQTGYEGLLVYKLNGKKKADKEAPKGYVSSVFSKKQEGKNGTFNTGVYTDALLVAPSLNAGLVLGVGAEYNINNTQKGLPTDEVRRSTRVFSANARAGVTFKHNQNRFELLVSTRLYKNQKDFKFKNNAQPTIEVTKGKAFRDPQSVQLSYYYLF